MGYYNHYKGARQRRHQRLKIVLLVFLLLIFLAVVALFILHEQAIFTADGFHFGKQEPAASDNTPAAPADPDVNLVIEGSDGTTTPDKPNDDTPSVPSVSTVLAYFSMGEQLLDGKDALLTAMQSANASQLALQIKGADGSCLLDDGTGAENSVSPRAADFKAATGQLPAGTSAIAVVSAMKDGARPRSTYRNAALHTASGATWLDYDYISWFDPASADTATYLTNLVSTCKDAGFSQVLFSNFQYPSERGKLNLIVHDDNQTTFEALNTLAKTLRESTDLPLSMLLTDTAAQTLQDGIAGQDVTQLAKYFDILYVQADSPEVDLQALQQAVSGTDCRIGVFLTQPGSAPTGVDCILAGDAN